MNSPYVWLETPTGMNSWEFFDYLLEKYVKMALMFYDDECFVEEVRCSNYFDNEQGISKEKVIMTLLWSNASYEDFNDPCTFLKKRISFFELGEMKKYLSNKVVGYSEVINADIDVVILKNRLDNNGENTNKFISIYFTPKVS